MINVKQISAAMKLVKDPSLTKRPVYESVETQLAHSLLIYKERGEYRDGSFTDAMICLELAGYELADE